MKELSTQNLKSNTAIIQQLYPLIFEAVHKGYSQIFIHEKLTNNNLKMSLGSYRVALHRIKKGFDNGTRQQPYKASPIQENLKMEKSMNLDDEEAVLATQVSSNLRKSVLVAKQDYSKIAKDKLKSNKKN